jgi:probable phosphoglycerate mutase
MSEDLTFCQLHVIDETGEKDWFFAGQNTKLLEGAFHSDWYRHAEAAGCLTAKAGYERIQTESDAFIEKLGYKRNGAVYKIHKPSDKRVAVFCHHGMGTAWLSHLLNIPPLIFWAGFNIGHSGVTIIDFENHENGLTAPRCLVLSDLGHIYEARLPMEYNNGIRI